MTEKHMNYMIRIITGFLPLFLVYAVQAMEAPLSRVALPQARQNELSSNNLLTACLAHAAYYTPETQKSAEIDTNQDLLQHFPLLNSLLQANKIEYVGSIEVGKNKQIRVLAFYAGTEKRIIYVIRGTFVRGLALSNLDNLFADLGIGRHKSNADLIRSINLAQQNLSEQGVADLTTTSALLESLKSIISARVTSHNPAYRAIEPIYRGMVEGANSTWSTLRDTVTAPLTSGTNRTAAASAALGAVVATTFAAGSAPALIPLAVSAGGYAACGAALNVLYNGTYSAAKATTTGLLTLNDGYEQLIDHVKLLWASSQQLKNFAQQKGLEINDTLWIGHSLGGWLALFGAILNENEGVGYNPPGLCIEEALAIAAEAGIINGERAKYLASRRETIASKLHTIRMSTCTIGMLGNRDGKVTEFNAKANNHYIAHRRSMRKVHGELISKVLKEKLKPAPFETILLEQHSMLNLMQAIFKQKEYEQITPLAWDRAGLERRRTLAQSRPDMLHTLKQQAFAEAIRKAHPAERRNEQVELNEQASAVVNDVPRAGWLTMSYWGSYFGKKS